MEPPGALPFDRRLVTPDDQPFEKEAVEHRRFTEERNAAQPFCVASNHEQYRGAHNGRLDGGIAKETMLLSLWALLWKRPIK